MTRFRCVDCGDEMDVKFARTHPILCRLAAILAAETVRRLLGDLGLADD